MRAAKTSREIQLFLEFLLSSMFTRPSSQHTAPRMSPRRVFVFALVACVFLNFAPSTSAGGVWESHKTQTADTDPKPTHVPANAPGCVSCEIIARELERSLYELEGHDVEVEGLTEQEHARRASRRRKMMHGRSELQIDDVLDGFCVSFANDKTLDGSDRDYDVLPNHCDTLVASHRESIGDHVFANGPRKMREFLCVRLGRICPKLIGAGHDDQEL